MGSGAGRRREPSQRQRRVNETLRHALAELLGRRELRDPALANRSITVSEVQVSPDLRSAVVYVSPLGGNDIEAVIEGLARAAPHVGAQLARMVRLKTMPRLSFVADRSFDDAGRLGMILRGLESAEPETDDDR